jgi:hypothetical protein
MMDDPSTSPSDANAARLVWLYRSAFSRNPSELELQAGLQFLSQHSSGQTETEKLVSTDAAWRDLAHALVNAKEFIFIR